MSNHGHTRTTTVRRRPGLVAGALAPLLLLGAASPALASPLKNAIIKAEQQFGGEAFLAERYREDGRTYIEVELLVGNRIVEAEYSVRSGQFNDAETYGTQRRVARIRAALNRAQLSLADAAQIAEDAVGPGTVQEAKLQIARKAKRNGTRFVVEVDTREDDFDVIMASRTGRVLRIRPD